MASKNWSLKDLKDKGLVESDGAYVPVSSLVSKKVEKIVPEYDIMVVDPTPNFKVLQDIYKTQGILLVTNSDALFLPTGESIYPKFRFDINPVPAPRMTGSDKWKTDPNHKDPRKRQRACVTHYFAFKREFMRQAGENGFVLDETLRILFIIPMPKTWSKKKRLVWNNMPHKQRPDVDNLTKSAMDSSGVDDGYVWDIRAIKLWGEKPEIIIF